MKSIAIIYGSSTGNTKYAAQLIAEKLAGYSPVLKDLAGASGGRCTYSRMSYLEYRRVTG